MISEFLSSIDLQFGLLSAQDSGGSSDTLNIVARWLHITAGITWIGLLYFFNFINGGFTATMDAETKRKVVPQLVPRVLFWFRWGAAFTWITGVVLFMVVYMGKAAMYSNGLDMEAGLSSRTVWILLGAVFGTIMAFNVWFIIWPAQKQIIPAIRDGQAPPAGLPARATMASKVNTYLSVPLLLTMVSNSVPSIFGMELAGSNHVFLLVMVVIGLAFVKGLYMIAPRIKGM
ncbi:MAG TPA: urate hydroxylase PuuD [Planctomycetota bacterium]